MPSSQKAQHFFIKRLYPDINSIDAILTYQFEKGLMDISRVGLDRYFRVQHQIEVFLYIYQDAFELLWAEKRRSAASKVDSVKRIESVVVHLHLFEEGIKKIRNSRDGS